MATPKTADLASSLRKLADDLAGLGRYDIARQVRRELETLSGLLDATALQTSLRMERRSKSGKQPATGDPF